MPTVYRASRTMDPDALGLKAFEGINLVVEKDTFSSVDLTLREAKLSSDTHPVRKGQRNDSGGQKTELHLQR